MNLPPDLMQQFFDSNGDPLASGKVYTYAAGTSTNQSTYTDQAGGTPNANPVVLDAYGRCTMWLDPDLSYKFVVKDSNDSTVKTIDNVVGLSTVDGVNTEALQDDCVTQDKIADDAVGAAQLKDDASTDANRAVTSDHIRNSAITAVKVASSAFSSYNPANLSLAASVASSALTVSVKDAAGSTASSTSPVKIPFRSSTATDGAPVVRSVTAALSVVVPSTATLGHTSANLGYVYVYALDNAGTVELAVSATRMWDESALQTTTAMSTSADSAIVLYSENARTNVAIRYLGRLKSTQATAGTWATAISQIDLPNLGFDPTRSVIRLDTHNGYGAVNTKITRFTTTTTNTGTAFVYADSANNGMSITVARDCLAAIEFHADWSASCHMGISLNSSQLTTDVQSITKADAVALSTTTAAAQIMMVTATLYLRTGDVIRTHTNGVSNGGQQSHMFRITELPGM